jgi:hypothetical protein
MYNTVILGQFFSGENLPEFEDDNLAEVYSAETEIHRIGPWTLVHCAIQRE